LSSTKTRASSTLSVCQMWLSDDGRLVGLWLVRLWLVGLQKDRREDEDKHEDEEEEDG